MPTITLDSAFDPASRETWEELAERSLKGQSLDALTANIEGLAINALYDTRPDDPVATASNGILASKHRAPHQWDNRARLTGSSTATYREHAVRSLAGGVTSINIPLTTSPVTDTTGVACSDLEQIVSPIKLDLAPITLSPNASPLAFQAATNQASQPALDMQLRALWLDQGHAATTIRGAVHFDPVGHWLQQGFLHAPIEDELSALADIVKRHQDCPALSLVMVNGAVHHVAGATRTEELVATLATATLYAEHLLAEGVPITQVARQITLNIAVDADHLLNVIKLRVLRQLWQHTLQAMGAEATAFNLIAETSSRMLGCEDLWANHLRHVSAAAAAAMGRATALVVNPHNHIADQWCDDDVLLGERMARNIPIILEAECGLLNVTDPLAGSYAAETLTKELGDAVWQQLETFGNSAGFVDAIRKGQWQSALTTSQAARVAAVREETRVQVGINRFRPNESDAKMDSTSTDKKSAHALQQADAIQPLPIVRDAMAIEALS